MITIQKYSTPEDVVHGKFICTSEGLYVHGWCFEQWLTDPRYIVQKIYILAVDNVPVAAAICLDPESPREGYENVGIFVADDYRLVGLGTQLIQELYDDTSDQTLMYDEGVDGSLVFFEKAVAKYYQNPLEQ